MLRKLKNNTKGFTLIEMLTVMLILVIVSTVISSMIFTVLQGTTRSKAGIVLAENGNNALSVISNIILSSSKVEYIDGDDTKADCTTTQTGKSIQLLRSDGGHTILSFDPTGYISSGSADLPANTAVALFDKAAVKVDTGDPANAPYDFKCEQSNPFARPIITVEFTLIPNYVVTSSGGKDVISSKFKVQVLMRNYQQG